MISQQFLVFTWDRSVIPTNIKLGFKWQSISPFDVTVFIEEVYLSSHVMYPRLPLEKLMNWIKIVNIVHQQAQLLQQLQHFKLLHLFAPKQFVHFLRQMKEKPLHCPQQIKSTTLTVTREKRDRFQKKKTCEQCE